MLPFLPPDWPGIFTLETPLADLLARGSVLYLGVLVLMRVMPRRSGGELARMDLVFVLLIAEAATHGFGDYTSVTDAFVVIITLMAWDYLINVLSYRFPAFERLIAARAVQVVRDGRLLRRNMRREFLTEDELMGFLRREGIEDLSVVKSVCVESEGRLSVVRA